MKELISKYKILIAALSILILFATNYSDILSSLDSNFIGLICSVILFAIGSKKTNFSINYLLVALIIVLEFVSYNLNTKSIHSLSIILFLCLVIYDAFQHFF